MCVCGGGGGGGGGTDERTVYKRSTGAVRMMHDSKMRACMQGRRNCAFLLGFIRERSLCI